MAMGLGKIKLWYTVATHDRLLRWKESEAGEHQTCIQYRGFGGHFVPWEETMADIEYDQLSTIVMLQPGIRWLVV